MLACHLGGLLVAVVAVAVAVAVAMQPPEMRALRTMTVLLVPLETMAGGKGETSKRDKTANKNKASQLSSAPHLLTALTQSQYEAFVDP